MIIITSAAFISSEFQVELGKLPPSFLPLGNRRFYEHQIERLKKIFPFEQIYLSVTEAYQLSKRDSLRLNELSVNIVPIPDQLKLGESVLTAINSIGIYDEGLRILHGDTLLDDFPSSLDIIGVAHSDDDYAWEIENTINGLKEVWCGYFSFSDIKLLAQALSRNRGDFVSAIRDYQIKKNQKSISVTGWKDLGHINTYYKARAEFTTERAFNQLKIHDGIVRKTSSDEQKISSEWKWLSTLPPALKKYAPSLIQAGNEDGKSFYDIEYLPHLPLSELYVFGALSLEFWRKIFKISDKLLSEFRHVPMPDLVGRVSPQKAFEDLVISKTWARLAKYIDQSGDDIDKSPQLNGEKLPPVRMIVREAQSAILSTRAQYAVVHGDFCFSNLLFDSRVNALKLIDPRGIDGVETKTHLGDQRYDCAKFIHSVVGHYDSIIAQNYELKEQSPQNFSFRIEVEPGALNVANYFLDSKIAEYSVKEILPLVILLFFSMLPLHSDSPLRQRAMYANALRIYGVWKEI